VVNSERSDEKPALNEASGDVMHLFYNPFAPCWQLNDEASSMLRTEVDDDAN